MASNAVTQYNPDYNVGVRDAIKGMGVSDDRITYDAPSGYVLVDNQRVFRPEANYGGRTHASQASIDAIRPTIANLNAAYRQPPSPNLANANFDQFRNPPVFNGNTGQPIQQPVQVPQTAQQTQPPAQTMQPTVQQPSLPAAYSNIAPQANPLDPQINALIGMLLAQAQNPTPIDRNAAYASPQYAASQAQAQQGAQRAIRAAQEALGGAGFGRSTVLGERAQEAQNEANQYLETQVLPQIISQLQNERAQQTAGLYDVLGALTGQQGIYDARDQARMTAQRADRDFDYGVSQDRAAAAAAADQTAYNREQDAIKNAAALRKEHFDLAEYLTETFNVLVHPTDDPMESYAQVAGIPTAKARKIAEDARQTDFENAIKAALAENTISTSQANLALEAQQMANSYMVSQRNADISQQNADTSRMNADTSRLNAERGEEKPPTATEANNQFTAEVVTNLDKMPDNVKKSFFANEKAAIIRQLGQSGYEKLYNMYFDEYGDPR